MHLFKVRPIFFLLLVSSTYCSKALSACFIEVHAKQHGCLRVRENQYAADRFCQKRYGRFFQAYITDDQCSRELAYSTRGQTAPISRPHVADFLCLTYEQNKQLRCREYRVEQARFQCAMVLGGRYAAFLAEGENCTEEKASKLRGEKKSWEFFEGLETTLRRVEALMLVIDRQGLYSSALRFNENYPLIKDTFEIDIVEELIATMENFKSDVERRTQWDVGLSEKEFQRFSRFVIRYMEVLKRLYKMYYLAHHNNPSKNKFTKNGLDYLSPRLQKIYAYNILSSVNYKAKTVVDENGMNDLIELVVSDQEKQILEILVLEKPKSKNDYAKVITLKSMREYLNNFWALERLSENKIEAEQSFCGDFLTTQPGLADDLRSIGVLSENFTDDLFNGNFQKLLPKMIEGLKGLTLLDEETSYDLARYVLVEVPEIKIALRRFGRINLDKQLHSLAKGFGASVLSMESMEWDAFVEQYQNLFFIPDHLIKTPSAIKSHFFHWAYERKKYAIKNDFLRRFFSLEKNDLDLIEEKVDEYLDQNIRLSFQSAVDRTLAPILSEYLDQSETKNENRSNKVDQIANLVVDSLHAAIVAKKRTLVEEAPIKLRVRDPDELMFFFQHRIERELTGVYQALFHKEEWQADLDKFFEMAFKQYKDFQKFSVKLNKEQSHPVYEDEILSARDYQESDLRKAFELAVVQFKNEVLNPAPPSISFEERYFQNRCGQSVDGVVGPECPRSSSSDQIEERTPVDASNNPWGLSNEEIVDIVAPVPDHCKDYPPGIYTIEKLIEVGCELSLEELDDIYGGYTLEVDADIEYIGKSQLNKLDRRLLFGHISQLKVRALFEDVLNEIDFEKAKESSTAAKRKVLKDIPKDKIPATKAMFFHQVFKALNLQYSSYQTFLRTKADQRLIAQYRLARTFSAQPFLQFEVDYKEKQNKLCVQQGSSSYRDGATYRRGDQATYVCGHQWVDKKATLLERIAMTTYSLRHKRYDLTKVKEMISNHLDQAPKKFKGKLEQVCRVDYANYKTDENFRIMFEGAVHHRAGLAQDSTLNYRDRERFKNYDIAISKEVRTFWEWLNEDILEPGFIFFGAATIICIIILSGGSLLPAAVAYGVGLALSGLLVVDLIFSIPATVISTSVRMNQHFIEVPARLKIQSDLSFAQLDGSKMIDSGDLKARSDANTTDQWWTVGFIPLDIAFFGFVGHEVLKGSGTLARWSYKSLSGQTLRFARPPKVAYNTRALKELQEQEGYIKGTFSALKDRIRNLRMTMPNRVALPQSVLHTAPLRQGIINVVSQGDGWGSLMKEVKRQLSELKSTASQMRRFNEIEQALVESVKGEVQKKTVVGKWSGKLVTKYFVPEDFTQLTRPMSFWEHFEEMFMYSKYLWIAGELRDRLFSLNPIKVIDFFYNYRNVWSKLKEAQGAVVQKRIDALEKIIKLDDEAQAAFKAGQIGQVDIMARVLMQVEDSELYALKFIGRDRRSSYKQLVKTFKQHHRVVETLRPISDLRFETAVLKNTAVDEAKAVDIFIEQAVDLDKAFRNSDDALESLLKHYRDFAKNQVVPGQDVQRLMNDLDQIFKMKGIVQ